jgi:hydrogenase-4 component F
MLLSLILVPVALAALTFVIPSERWRRWLLPLGALAHLALTVRVVADSLDAPPLMALGGWLVLDELGRLLVPFLALFFFLVAAYVPGYLALRPERPNRLFCANLFLVLGMMTLVALSHHLGLMWVAMEATTLACAPLLYFNQNPSSLEATWKYLLVGSVGIALALLGSFFLAYSSLYSGLPSTLLFEDLVKGAPRLSAPWLHAAFVLLLVGYGTKMGIAPMHTWKPDAYGEAPGAVGALLTGGMCSVAFLALLRCYRICSAGAGAEVARHMLVTLGLLSMGVAGVFMIRQRDFKRLLAYSSVEHMGILILGIGIGGPLAVYGSLLHLLNNGFTKGVLFLAAANIHRAYGSKHTTAVRGALRRLPLSGGLLLAGFLAITGSPPFGPFVSEFTIATAAFGKGGYLVGGLFLTLLAVAFVGMGSTVLAVVQGTPPPEASKTPYRDGLRTGLPIVVLMALVLLLGLYIPAPLDALLRDAAASLEVKP